MRCWRTRQDRGLLLPLFETINICRTKTIINMKTIKEALNKIEIQEKTIEKIGKFLKTKRGMTFVTKLDTASTKELCRRYSAPKFIIYCSNDIKNKNLIRAAIKKYDIIMPTYKPINTEPVKQPKTPVRLTIKEMKKMNATRPKKMGFAALMHALEEHKIEKFRTRCPWLFKDDKIQGDLFSDEMYAQQKTQLYLHREYTRNFLAKAYSHVENREYFYRLFLVKENKSNLAEHKIYEVEGDPMAVGYPFTMCTENTSLDIIREILYSRAKMLRARGGDLPLELKLYNKYGKLITSTKI